MIAPMRAFLPPILSCCTILLAGFTLAVASPTSSGSDVSLLPDDSLTSGGRVSGGNITADISVGGAISGGVSNLTTNNVEVKAGYTGQLYDGVSMVLATAPGTSVTGGGTLQLSATVTLDDDTTLETSTLTWETVSGPIAGIDGTGLLSAGFPNTSSAATVRGTFDLLSETLGLTVNPLAPDPYTFSLDELGGTGPYRVLFGDSPTSLTESNPTGSTFNPGPLVPGQTYYWQVFDSTNANLTPGGDGIVRLLAGQDLELLKVTDPGNPADVSGYGAVAAPFWIGSFELTNRQYAAFLNAVAGSDPNGLFDPLMASNPVGGIERFGPAGDYTYAAKTNMAEKPVNFVTFWSACRYINWLHNGLPNGAQGPATTEDGAYDLTDPSALTNNTVVRKAGAEYHLPDQDEWDKAAYYDPRTALQNGPPGDDNYWLYPTLSDTPPTVASADATGNIDNDTDPIANYASGADWNSQSGNVTTVGSGGIGATSFYGASDMAGNVREMLEDIDGTNRLVRGGDFAGEATTLAATDSSAARLFSPFASAAGTGIRVAAFEPPPPVVAPPPASPVNNALRLKYLKLIKKLKGKAKKAKKSGNSGKAKKFKKKMKAAKKKLKALG